MPRKTGNVPTKPGPAPQPAVPTYTTDRPIERASAIRDYNLGVAQNNRQAEERLINFLQQDESNEEPVQPDSEETNEDAEPEADEGQAAQGEVEESGEEEESAGDSEGDEEGAEITSLGDLAEHLGVEVADLYNLHIPVNDIDGVRKEITLGEWKDGYQQASALQKAQKEAAEEKAKWTQQLQQSMESYHRQASENAALMQNMEKMLFKEFENTDWNNLRVENPVEWAARRQEFQERQTHIQNMRQQAAQRYNEVLQQHQEAQKQVFSEMIKEEMGKLHQAIPEWRDENLASAEKAQLYDYLRALGYTDQEISNAADHRPIVLARKAMLHDLQQQTADVAKKKVVKIGKKVLKPGTRQTKAEAKHDARKKARQKLRETGRLEDFLTAYKELGME